MAKLPPVLGAVFEGCKGWIPSAEAHQPISMTDDGRVFLDGFAQAGFGNPGSTVVPQGPENRVAGDGMETGDFGKDTEVANGLVDAQLVCHGEDLLKIL